jgi:hypothetical protein
MYMHREIRQNVFSEESRPSQIEQKFGTHIYHLAALVASADVKGRSVVRGRVVRRLFLGRLPLERLQRLLAQAALFLVVVDARYLKFDVFRAKKQEKAFALCLSEQSLLNWTCKIVIVKLCARVCNTIVSIFWGDECVLLLSERAQQKEIGNIVVGQGPILKA